ncbi:MAG: hypothetical protein ACYC92_08390 [Candidatus Acidiferrales bacterium]
MKHLACMCVLVCVMAMPALAQGGRHNDIALGRDGHVAPGASIAVCTAQGIIGYGNSPCSPLATIYTDSTLATAAANPFVADSNGDYGFWAPPGTYQVQIYGPQIGTYIQTVTIACVPNSATAGCGSTGTSQNNTWTGTNTFSADAYFKSGEPWFDVKAFGAKCDDTTDDTAAIQATLAAIPPTGGLVMIPGVCKFTSTLVINTPDVTLEGKGHFQFITQNAPVTYLDFQGATGNAILVSAQGFKMRDVGVKYPTTIGGPLAPPAAPTLTQIAGTGCPAEAYYVQTTYLNPQGETSDSAEATFTTTSGNCLQVQSPPALAGATGWNLYVSSNPNNETKQNSTPLAIGTSWTFGGTLVNLAYRPPFNTTAYSAIYDNNGAQLDGVKLFTDAASSAGAANMANGYTSFGCCGKLNDVYIAGFGVGIAGAGANNDFSVMDSFIQSNNVGAFVVNGADINFTRNDFEGNVVGNIKMLYGSPYTLSHNYFEQQGTNPPSYNVQVGDTSIPPQGFTPTPGAIFIDGNFMQCNLTAYPPAPIVVDIAASLDIEKNSFSQCGNQNIIANFAGAGASIKVLGNISDHAPLAWITSTSGLAESDLSGTSMTPGIPFFYGLGVDSTSGASSLLFRSGGASAWNIGASNSALSFGFNGHLGENTMRLAPFGSQSYASVQSNYAMDAAEQIVTQSGASATFDAGLGNTFEITLTSNVTSSTLVNAQPGQWLAFIVCQSGSGGPFTFAWPSNVFGGGTIGAVGGNCSTQTFYVSGANAWAVAPMIENLSTDTGGLSLPAVAGTVPYYAGTWTNGNCLQAGGSPGLIAVTASACGTGGSGGGLFSSFQIGANAPITSAGNYFQLAAGNNVTLGLTGAGTSASPYVATITAANTAATAWPAITGNATNTNTGFVLAPTATGAVPWTIDCPAGITVDCFDVELNGAKTFFIDQSGNMTASTLTLLNQNNFTLGSGSQTNASFYYAQSGNGASNSSPAYFEASGSPANAFNSFLFPCQSAGNWCVSATTPAADSNQTLAVHNGVNAQTGTTYTIANADEDGLTTFNNAAAIAVTLACPTATTFQNGWREAIKDLGAGTATITVSGCTITPLSSGTAGTTAAFATGVSGHLYSDGTNYQVVQ